MTGAQYARARPRVPPPYRACRGRPTRASLPGRGRSRREKGSRAPSDAVKKLRSERNNLQARLESQGLALKDLRRDARRRRRELEEAAEERDRLRTSLQSARGTIAALEGQLRVFDCSLRGLLLDGSFLKHAGLDFVERAAHFTGTLVALEDPYYILGRAPRRPRRDVLRFCSVGRLEAL